MCIAGKSLQYSYCDYWLYGRSRILLLNC
jgi:hypothetical protein